MQHIIISNNKQLKVALASYTAPIDFEFIDGSIRDVTFVAREMLYHNYCLVADPLAGRLERPSPYVSFFLEKKPHNPKMSEEILRIEYFIALYLEHQNHLEDLDEKHKSDFALVDTSLIVGCVQQIFGR